MKSLKLEHLRLFVFLVVSSWLEKGLTEDCNEPNTYFQASQALHYQALSQAKPRLDFEVQACSTQSKAKSRLVAPLICTI